MNTSKFLSVSTIWSLKNVVVVVFFLLLFLVLLFGENLQFIAMHLLAFLECSVMYIWYAFTHFKKKSTTSFGCVVLLGILVFYSTNLSVSSFLSLSVSSLTSTHKSSHTQLSKERLFGKKKSKKITIHFTLQQKHISLSLTAKYIYRHQKSEECFKLQYYIYNPKQQWKVAWHTHMEN